MAIMMENMGTYREAITTVIDDLGNCIELLQGVSQESQGELDYMQIVNILQEQLDALKSDNEGIQAEMNTEQQTTV